MLPRADLSPYIGGRYFDRTKDDHDRFFGRDREIAELVGLILSHNVVLVYGASGSGKTSLLNAGVIPELEREHLQVLPRSRVGVAPPPDVVLDEAANPYVVNLLYSLVGETGTPLRPRPTIADYLHGLPLPEDCAGRMLWIDQGEELFTCTPSKDWQRQQREFCLELRKALHDEPDLRVVIAAREDSLGRFEDLASLFPGELGVRFHLAPLTREAALEAVTRPLAATGTHRRFDEDAARRLVDDLSMTRLTIGRSGNLEEVPGPYVEPVQLQIVCDRLWRTLPADVAVITAEHLQHYGNVEDVLEHFYEETIDECVQNTRCDRDSLAHWFDDKLITSSDTRGQVFRGPRDTGGLPNRAVEILESRRLVHPEARAGGRWYELVHDRLIQPVRTVNRRWFAASARKRHRQRAIAAAAAFLGVLVATNGINRWWHERQAEKQRDQAQAVERATVEPIVQLRLRCGRTGPAAPPTRECKEKSEQVFGAIADYYWSQAAEKPEKLDKLVALLREAADLIPADYGVPDTAPASVENDRNLDRVRIAYNPGRAIDSSRMRAEWARVAQELGSVWGLSVVPGLTLIRDPALSLSAARIATSLEVCQPQGQQSRARVTMSSSVDMPLMERQMLITLDEVDKDAQLRRMYDRYGRWGGWGEYADPESDTRWLLAPAWLSPAFRASGHRAVSAEAVLSIVMEHTILAHPELVLGCDAARTLVQHAAAEVPKTAEEAVAARGWERLRLDLIELIGRHNRNLLGRHNRNLRSVYLPTLLDVLANHPDLPTAEAAAVAYKEQDELGTGDDLLHGPWAKAGGNERGRLPVPRPPSWSRPAPRSPASVTAPGPRNDSYGRFASYLQPIEPAIRVDVGPAVMASIAEGSVLREQTRKRLSTLRGDLYRRYGVIAPIAQFRTSDNEGLRIEVLNRSAGSPATQTLAVPAGEAPDRLYQALTDSYHAFRGWWSMADTIFDQMSELRDSEQSWLTANYSLTDLKRIARAVVMSNDERDGANTLRDLPWLIKSLVFWSEARDPRSLAQLSTALRDTQRARQRSPEPPRHPGHDRIDAMVRRGVTALDLGQIEQAGASFKAALRANHDAAIAAFLDQYPGVSSVTPAQRTRRVLAKCDFSLPGLWSDPPDDATMFEFEDLLASAGDAISPADHWHMEVCMAWAVDRDRTRPREAAQRISALLTTAPPQIWKLNEAYFLAQHWLVANRGAVTPPDAELSAVRQLLVRHFADQWSKAFPTWQAMQWDLGDQPPAWQRDLIVGIAARLAASSSSMKLEIVAWLTGFGRIEAAQAESLADAIDPGPMPTERWSLAFIKAAVQTRLSEYGDPALQSQLLGKATASFQQLAPSAPSAWQSASAYAALADAYRRADNLARAREAIRGGVEVIEKARSGRSEGGDELLPVWAGLREQELFLELGEDNEKRAGEIVAELVLRAPNDASTTFASAVFAILTKGHDFDATARSFVFRNVKNPHLLADYVRLMLSWALATSGHELDAKQILHERMNDIHKDTWGQRLQQRDTTVWREMLVAMFAGEIPNAEIFDALQDDESFRRSGLDQTELSLEGARCEAYFYLALRESFTRDADTREVRYRRALQRALDTKVYGYLEYRMAEFLLHRDTI